MHVSKLMFSVRQVCEKYLPNGEGNFGHLCLEMLVGMEYGRCDWSQWSVWKWMKVVESRSDFYVDSRACVRVGMDVSKWLPVNV